MIPDTERRCNILVAYPYMQQGVIETLTEARGEIRLVLDSGAFTAWRTARAIELDDYCRFIESLPIEPWRYFVLDVIGNPEGTHRNYETMLARGFRPVPIFTRGEDPAELDRYYETSDLVGIGGLVGTHRNKGFVNGIMRRVAGRPAHLLGFSRLEFLKAHRPYMCDASTWEGGGRYGSIPLYLGHGVARRVYRKDFQQRPPVGVARKLVELGVDPYRLAKPEAWTGGPTTARYVGAVSAVELSLAIQRNLGTLYFNAAATNEGCRMLIKGFRHLSR